MNYGVRKKIRRGQKIVGIVSKLVMGYIPKDQISITQIDGFCSKLRERIGCFVRRARSFVKRKLTLEQRLEIFGTQHNFMEAKHGETPAMLEGVMRRKLTWSEVLHTRLSYSD